MGFAYKKSLGKKEDGSAVSCGEKRDDHAVLKKGTATW